MREWAELVRAVASLLWPVVALTVVLIFRQPLKDILGRLKRGRVLGQEIELEQSLRAFDASARAAASEIPEVEQWLYDNASDRQESSELAQRILEQAARSPKVALLLLASELEREVRHLLASMGLLQRRHGSSLPQYMRILEERGALPKHLAGSVQIFWDLRNRLVHGHQASDDDVLRAIDSGLTVLRTIRSIPHELNYVYHPGVEVYADEKGQEIRPGVKAIILETTSPGGATKTRRVYPTTRTHFEKGKRVSWEWNQDLIIGQSWYRDPDTGEISHGWDKSMEFAGRLLEDV